MQETHEIHPCATVLITAAVTWLAPAVTSTAAPAAASRYGRGPQGQLPSHGHDTRGSRAVRGRGEPEDQHHLRANVVDNTVSVINGKTDTGRSPCP